MALDPQTHLLKTFPSALVALGNSCIIFVPWVLNPENEAKRLSFTGYEEPIFQIALGFSVLFALYVAGLSLVFVSEVLRWRFDANHRKRVQFMLNHANERLFNEWKEKEVQARVLSGFILSIAVSMFLNFPIHFVGTENGVILFGAQLLFWIAIAFSAASASWKLAKLLFMEIDEIVFLESDQS